MRHAWLIGLLLAWCAAADDTGWLTGASAANQARGGGITWTTTSNATGAPDSAYSDASLGSGQESNWIVVTNFSAGIPAGSVIEGVQVRFTGLKDESDGGFGQMEAMSLVTGGSVAGTAKTAIWASWNTNTQGGASDLWGLSLSDSDVNSSGFGAAVWGGETDDFGDSVILRTDSIEIKIYYTPPATGGSDLWFLFYGAVVGAEWRVSRWSLRYF